MDRFTFAASAAIEGNTLSGVAHAFGKRTLHGNHYVEFAKSAFDKALATSDVRAFWNHNTDLLLGRQSAGTVRLATGADGLRYEIDLPDTTYANDMKNLIARGDLRDMSFGVIPGKTVRAFAPDGKRVDIHTEVAELFDISPVSLPAFEGTSVQLHSASPRESVQSQLIRARSRVNKEK